MGLDAVLLAYHSAAALPKGDVNNRDPIGVPPRVGIGVAVVASSLLVERVVGAIVVEFAEFVSVTANQGIDRLVVRQWSRSVVKRSDVCELAMCERGGTSEARVSIVQSPQSALKRVL